MCEEVPFLVRCFLFDGKIKMLFQKKIFPKTRSFFEVRFLVSKIEGGGGGGVRSPFSFPGREKRTVFVL